jgi:acetolactate synthase-1/2/3 large subunit
LIGIGTRLEMPYMRWAGMMQLMDRPQAPPHMIRIDIDPAEMRRLVPHAGIVADAGDGARALLEALRRGRDGSFAADADAVQRRASIAEAKAQARAATQKVQPQMAYLDVIRDVLPRDGFFVTELSQVGFASYFGFPVYEPRTYVSEGYQGTLGFGFPTALGVKVAHPDKAVVSVTGDGGFMFSVQELATAVQEDIALVTIVFNNRSYGNVLRDQRTSFGNRVIGSVLHNPDFMQLAGAFGIAAHLVASPQALKPVLAEALASRRAALIEVETPQGSEVSPWEFIHPPARSGS